MTTDVLSLPEITAGQSQKEVTHNEALYRLEGLLSRVKSRTTSAEPSSPSEGDIYIVPAGATGTNWSGQDNNIAHYYGGSWHFYAPVRQVLVGVIDEDLWVHWTGSAWETHTAQPADASLTPVHIREFAQDTSTTSGTTFGHKAGRVRNDNVITDVSAGTVALTDDATNYVELTPAGSVVVNTSSFTAGRIPLFVVVVSSGSIDTVTDKRALIAADNQGSGGSGVSDFDEDGATTTGLTWGYNAGTIRKDNAITSVAAGTVSLTASTTNYVEVDDAGAVSVNQSGFTAGRIPLRELTTDGSSITASTDKRGLFLFEQYTGDFKADGSVPMTGTLKMAGNQIQRFAESKGNVGLTSGTLTLDFNGTNKGNHFAVTLTEDVTTVTFSNIPSSGVVPFTIELTQDGTGGRTVGGWPGGAKWPGGSAPTITSAAGAVDVISGYTPDGGTTYRLGRAFEDSK